MCFKMTKTFKNFLTLFQHYIVESEVKFHQHSTISFCDCSFTLSILAHSVEQGSQAQFHTGHILTKKGIAGRINRKNVPAGRNRRLKVPLYCKKSSFSNHLSNFNYVAGHMRPAGRVFETPGVERTV